jgi:3-phenylpropionate/cinnamic acid dioxygenase small subunit
MPAAPIDDWFAINNLFVRYATALDACDVETVVACFEADGWLESPVLGRFDGSDGIREFAMRTVRLKEERGVQFRHVVSNLRVEVEGTRAQAWCYLLDFMTHDGTTDLLSPGEYDCELKKTDGAWRFIRRTVTMDRSFTLPGGASNVQTMKNAPSNKPMEEKRAEDPGTRRIE